MSRPRPRAEPLYLQIAEGLKEKIGDLGPGARIPSEPKLAKDWGVSRFTVAKAVEQLVDEGLITRRQGSGSFVAEAPLRRAPGYLLSFTEAVEAAGHKSSHRLLAFEPIIWTEDLPYTAGTAVVLLDRLRLVDGRAVARHRSVLSADLVAETGLTIEVCGAAAFSLYRHLERNGLSVASATERLVACSPTDQDRSLLKLPKEAVVVSVTRHSFAGNGRPLDAVSAIYDARRYSYEARLVRQHHAENHRTKEHHDEETGSTKRSFIGPRLGPWNP